MKKITVLVSNKGKVETREVEAYPTKCPQLFVHHSMVREGTDKTWTITHEPSGYSLLTGLKRKSNAIKACEIMSELEGWDTATPKTSSAFFEKHRALLLRAREIAWGGKGE